MMQKYLILLYLILIFLIMESCDGNYQSLSKSTQLVDQNKPNNHELVTLIVELDPSYENTLKTDSDIRIVVKNNSRENICLPLNSLEIYTIEQGVQVKSLRNQVVDHSNKPCVYLVPKGSKGFVEWEYWISLDVDKSKEINIRIISKGKIVKDGMSTDQEVQGSMDLLLKP
jgi:hypothetical protein